MKRKTLEDVARAHNSDLRVRIRYPRLPYYLFDAADDLENLARTLDDMRDEQDHLKHENDEWWSLDDTNLEEIAAILRKFARSEKAREIIFSSGKKSEGRPKRHTDRDYLFVLEWCLRRRLSGLEGSARDLRARTSTKHSRTGAHGTYLQQC